MSPDKSVFETYQTITPKNVRFGNKQYGSGIGIGRVRIHTDGRTLILDNVLHVPSLSRQLISLSAAITNGAVGNISNDAITLSKNNRALIIASKSGNLYKINANNATDNHTDPDEEHNEASEASDASSSTSTSDRDNDSDLNDYDNNGLDIWHKRLCHVNNKYIIEMAKRNVCLGLTLPKRSEQKSFAKTTQCVTCKIGKKTMKNRMSRSTPRASSVAQRLHSDISGVMDSPSLSGARYSVLFKDEHSNYRLVKFIKEKSAAFQAVKEVIAQIRADTGTTVRKLVTDRGSEYVSQKMREWLVNNLIGQELSAPTAPSQNRFIERDMRTVLETTRSALKEQSFPDELWEEALNTTIYCLDRSINTRSSSQTPYELYFGTKPSVKHIRIFGSLALTKVQPKKRSGYQKKLEDRASIGVLVGYEQDYNYRIYDPTTNKISITREVEFDEPKTMTLKINRTNDDEEQNMVHHETTATQQQADIFDQDPVNYEQAMKSQESIEWRKAMDEEMRSLEYNKTWDLIDRPLNQHIISSKWVFKKKIDSSNIIRFKARLVARGFSQTREINYDETYSPVVRTETIRILLAMVTKLNMHVQHFDIKTAYLNGELREHILMEPPQGHDHGGKVCKLRRSLGCCSEEYTTPIVTKLHI